METLKINPAKADLLKLINEKSKLIEILNSAPSQQAEVNQTLKNELEVLDGKIIHSIRNSEFTVDEF